jgi:hypothetical protein
MIPAHAHADTDTERMEQFPVSVVSGSNPVCQQSLPNNAKCINNLTGPAQALCNDRAFSCSTGSGTCSSHGGVYRWRQ